ncbi:NAD(P)-dependent oxidoreductase [Candidatus Uabimicrobium amorphum]|uniref:D-3-phosphoglycerate dehydrogenase SerA n=1 Tax=Uabimicrobium amorphum TaxID=2596890 RepID=A0A5S9IR93_UABAM|nr:NAD(P)-dependent oxidoreductase [Candidatus Uabimicrobium amorphum]BBM86444.1 D-3-phosphoglycerate dehydrogenase SerA [Candidatus Uabimicrobium amorphum]
MSNSFLMGIDIGGGGGRCLLLNVESGETLCESISWTHRTIPNSIGFYDLDTTTIWNSIVRVVRKVTEKNAIDTKNIKALAVSSVRYGMVIVDKQQKVIFAVPNIDGRAAMHAAQLGSEHGDKFASTSGHWPGAVLMGSRLYHLVQEHPEVMQQAHAVMSIGDWIAMRLTGVISTELSHASGSMLFDIKNNEWSQSLIKSLDIPKHIFPKVNHAGTKLGELQKNVANEIGLTNGTPVIVGGADTQSALLGSGATQAGDICIVSGTTAPVQHVQSEVKIQNHLWTESHIIPGLWVQESNAGPVGATLEFISKVIYNHPQAVAMLCAQAKTSSCGARGILSTMGIGVFDAREMNIPLGHLTVAPMIYPQNTAERQHIARAIVEGICYGISTNLRQLTDKVQKVIFTGGMSQSSLCAQILSSLHETDIHIPQVKESTALGAAICAGVGVGVFSDFISAAQKINSYTTCKTDEDHSSTYQNLYERWHDMAKSATSYNKLAGDAALQGVSEVNELRITDVTTQFRPRIFISADFDEKSLAQLREFADVHYGSYRNEMQLLTGDALVEALHNYHVFITEVDVLDAESLQKIPSLKTVVSCRGNAVNIDINACTMLGIPVLNTPGRNAVAVADLTVAFILMLARKLKSAISFLHDPEVEAGDIARMGMAHKQLQGYELWQKNIGLIGMGAVGRKVVERLLPFDVNILVYDPYLSAEDIAATGARSVSLPFLLENSDFISLHAAVTKETRNLISHHEFQKMKKTCGLVNTARAHLIDEQALITALQNEQIGGIALDVFSVEPPGADHPLLAFPNVIATPHVAGNTYEVSAHQGQIVVSELKKLLRGERPDHARNPEVLANFSWTQAAKKLSTKQLQQLNATSGPAVTDLDQEQEQEQQSTTNKKGMFSKLRNIVTTKKVAKPATENVAKPATQDTASVTQEVSKTPSQTPQTNEQQPQGDGKFKEICQMFLKLVEKDDAIIKFSNKLNICVQYVIPDTQYKFVVHYNKGVVTTYWGEAKQRPNVTLKMKAATFDGVLFGKINGVRAAMTGKLSFSGDTLKAMRMQKIEKDTIRLYTIARDKIGDPGNLENLAGTAPQKTTAQPVVQKTAETATAVQKCNDERDEVVEIFNELYQAGFITSTGGNVSVRNAKNTQNAWITPSQVYKGGLSGEMIVNVDLEGNPLQESMYNPSSERHLHTLIMKNRPEINAVVHTHAPQATALALSELPFLPISTEAVFVGEIPRVPFIMPGSRELAEEVAKAIGKGTAVLMQNHGLVVAAGTLRQAADLTHIIEQTAEKILACYAAGKEPKTLPQDAIEMLRGLGEMIV